MSPRSPTTEGLGATSLAPPPRLYPATWAPNSTSHRVVHPPRKPVSPVTSTRRPWYVPPNRSGDIGVPEPVLQVGPDLRQPGRLLIALGNDPIRQWPCHPDVRVVPGHR